MPRSTRTRRTACASVTRGASRSPTGRSQRFHAHQLSSFELFAYAVAAERPSAEARVRAIIDDLERQREGATHVFSQIEATERALARMWAVRLDAEEASPESTGATP